MDGEFVMYEFECASCGELFHADPKNADLVWEDENTLVASYSVQCPRCGRLHNCKENFKWDGITHIE